MSIATRTVISARRKSVLDVDDWVVRGALVVFGVFFLIALVVPLFMMVSRSVQDIHGEFVGLANYTLYFQTPALFQSINNSLFVAGLSTAIVIVLAYAYAHALTRTRMPFKGFFRVMAFVPLLSPSLLKAIALVYWFGNQGVLKEVLMGNTIYGPIGIVIASVMWTFPHAFLIISTALSLSDGRLYEAAEALKTPPAARLLHHYASRRAVRADQRDLRRLHPGVHGFRRAEGDRRQLQRARHGHI